MGVWRDQVSVIVATLAGKNGRYDERTPKMAAFDMVAVIGLYSQKLPSAIRRIAPHCVATELVDGDGLLLSNLIKGSPLSPEQYLFHSVPLAGGTSWRRTPFASSGLPDWFDESTYEPARERNLITSDNLDLVVFLRQTIDDYQRCLDQIAHAITLYPAGQLASADICKPFMSALRELAVDLEVLAENPPTTFSDNIRGALGAALTASSEATVDLANAAGDAAAWAGNQAGKVAGAAAEGFLSRANLATLAAASLVGFVVLKKYGVI